MSTAAPEALDRGAVPWLFAAALLTTLPHAGHQPIWLSLAAAVIFLGGAWMWRTGARLPSRWLLALLVITASAGVLAQFGTLFGRDAGVAMLVLFMAMKLLELKSRRDAHIVVVLSYFLLLTHYFYSQSLLTGLWLLAASVIVTATLIRLHGGAASAPLPTLRLAARLTAQALPLLLVLYLLFPRIDGPLWGLPKDAHSGKTGLSETMTPGSIADLALSAEVAFRVRFDGPPPEEKKRYWRGPVLEFFDGASWKPASPGPSAKPGPLILPEGPAFRYETTLEAHNQRWLLALDAPIALPAGASLSPTLTALTAEPLTRRQRYALSSTPDYRYNLDERPDIRERNLILPAGANPRTLALAAEWKAADPAPEALIRRALQFFGDPAFAYTLQPPLLGGQPVDDFLFSTRRGFCEHYASAFTVLMRGAGIPARVVAGYQGGEINPVDGTLILRQSDAHAWSEVWLDQRGWTRVDPTLAVAPDRAEGGIARAMASGEPVPALLRVSAGWLRQMRWRWEALNNTWNQYVLGYTGDRQREFLARLGFPEIEFRRLALLLAGASTLTLLAIAISLFIRRPPRDPALRQWRRALARLKHRGFTAQAWEGPLALARRVRQECPEEATWFESIVARYSDERYRGIKADAGRPARR